MNREDIIFSEKPTSSRFQDLEGKEFNNWVVLGYDGRKSYKGTQLYTYWW